MQPCDVIIPIWNQPLLTRRCLDSVESATGDPYRLLLIDNGSAPPTRQLLDIAAQRDPGRIQVIRNADNLGFIKAVNQGIRASTAPYVCLLNNDTVVTPGWLEEMVRIAEGEPAIGLVNPSSNTLGYDPPQRTTAGIRTYAATFAQHRGAIRELPIATGFCLLIKRSVIEAIGLFDERYGMGNFEDADFSRRATDAGYRCVQAMGAYVYHEEKASFKQQRGWEQAFRANQQIFYRQWGRPLRIVWEAHGREPTMSEAWAPVLLRLLQQGHWIRYSAPHETAAPRIRQYATAGPVATGPGWRWGCLWYILKRRKKPVDLAVVHDGSLATWLSWLHRCHHAVVLYRPAPHEVERQCQRLSRSQ